MKVSSVRFITTTAMLLALTVLFQMLRLVIPASPFQQILIGSLVNLCLIVSAGTAGLWSGVIISVVSPIIALAQGHIPFPWMLPFVIIGNVLLVICYALLMKKSQILGFAVGAVLKTAFLWIGVVLIGISLFNVPETPAKALSGAFSWLQLVTAVIGGVVSLPIVRALRPKKVNN